MKGVSYEWVPIFCTKDPLEKEIKKKLLTYEYMLYRNLES